MAERFGRYWLHEKIGHGGMAEVFRATIGPNPQVFAFDLALKRMHAEEEKDQSLVERFLTEADVGKFLRHPNLVRVYESGLVDGRPYIAMEYVWGHDLARLTGLLRRRRLRFPSDLAVYVALQVLRALDYVHGAKSPGGVPMDLVHRDVTPSNVYVTFGGEVKLGDFGIAHVSFLEPSEERGRVEGKVRYVPPEVLGGDAPRPAVDLWGLAVSLYEMLTARPAYAELSEADLMAGGLPALPPIHHVNPDIDPRLSRILSRALHANPRKRPHDAATFYRDLKLYWAGQGIHVDGQALARFVTELNGGAPTGSARRAPEGHEFGAPGYQAPVDMSPTRRYELRQRQRARLVPLLAGLVLLLLGGFTYGIYRVVTLPPRAAPASAHPPQAPVPALPANEANVDVSGFDFTGEEAMKPDEDPMLGLADPTGRFKVLLHLGHERMRLGRFEAALEAYAGALEVKPHDVPARIGKANALRSLKRFAQAEETVRSAIEDAPKNPVLQLLLGNILRETGKPAESRAAYDRCIELDPKSQAARAARKAAEGL